MKIREQIIEKFFFLCALASIFIVALITLYIFKEGLPLMLKYGIGNFVFGTVWDPINGQQYGIFPMIVGSMLVTLGAVAIGVPVGLACAVYLAELSNERMAKIIRPAVELLAGIPSVVYGFYGIVVIVPLTRRLFEKFDGGPGIFTASIVLAIMILPTIINITDVSLRAVPEEYKHGSLALGASHWQTIIKVLIPAAKSGILTGIILGMGRAIGETMAVIMVAGNTPKLPTSIFSSVRTLTSNIALEMGYAGGDHLSSLFATGIILFIFIMALNLIVNIFVRKAGK